MSAPLTPDGKKCSYEGCDQPATDVAEGRNRSYTASPDGHPGVAAYCDAHARLVAEEGSPEYEVVCPNCSCRFGVN